MDTVEVYQREDGRFDWRRKSENGQVVSTSGGQGYEERDAATDMAVELNPDAEVVQA